MPDAPPIDFSRLSFPSDKLTVGTIRAKAPRFFQPRVVRFTDVEEGLLLTERIVAEKAYAAALKQPDPHPDWRQDDLTLALMDVYKQFGLTTGIKHTRELKKGIEAAAKAQAQEHLGPRR